MIEKFTPGPWEVQNPMGDDIGLWIVQAGLEAYEWSTIAIVCRDEDRNGKHFITKAEQKANAQLFAQAPAMLGALGHLIDQAQKQQLAIRNGGSLEPFDVPQAIDRALTVYAAATGETP